jgi:hypothetical protein
VRHHLLGCWQARQIQVIGVSPAASWECVVFGGVSAGVFADHSAVSVEAELELVALFAHVLEFGCPALFVGFVGGFGGAV